MALGTVELMEDNVDFNLLSVGVAEVAFPAPFENNQPRQIHVQAPTTNTASVIVGKAGVLADLSQGGWEFPPGGNFILPFNAYSQLKAISSMAAQNLLVNYVWGAQ
jgi:hypothetical protein